jgi:4-hydroxy-tetrahydrodipicolinate synthase
MGSQPVLSGVVPALLTPFGQGGQGIDEDAFVALVEFVINAGVHGLYVAGTTGEAPLMSLSERKTLASLAVKAAKGRVKVAIQTGCVSTRDTLELTAHAAEIGADAAGIVTPYYYPFDEESLRNHYSQVAAAVGGFPLYLYNIPSRTGNDISPRLVKELANEQGNIVGIKDSSKDLERFMHYVAELSPGISVVMGTDSFILPAFLLGGRAAISAVGNLFPELVVKLYECCRVGDWKEAVKLQYRVHRIKEVLKGTAGLAVYKAALALRGIPSGQARAPQGEVSKEEMIRLEIRLRQEGLI